MTDNDEHVFAGEPHKALSRRRFLTETGRTLGAALASAGVFYELIDTLVQPPERVAFAATQPLQEQYIIQNLQIIQDNGSGTNSSNGTIPVVVHPLHDHVITAQLNVPANAKALQEAQHHLESVLLGLEQQFPPTPTGLGILVAWGLPYFQHYLPSLGKTSGFFKAGTRYPDYLPVDLVTSKLEGHANLETLPGVTDQWPHGYFQHGTTMHLSHLFEDLATW